MLLLIDFLYSDWVLVEHAEPLQVRLYRIFGIFRYIENIKLAQSRRHKNTSAKMLVPGEPVSDFYRLIFGVCMGHFETARVCAVTRLSSHNT